MHGFILDVVSAASPLYAQLAVLQEFRHGFLDVAAPPVDVSLISKRDHSIAGEHIVYVMITLNKSAYGSGAWTLDARFGCSITAYPIDHNLYSLFNLCSVLNRYSYC